MENAEQQWLVMSEAKTKMDRVGRKRTPERLRKVGKHGVEASHKYLKQAVGHLKEADGEVAPELEEAKDRLERWLTDQEE